MEHLTAMRRIVFSIAALAFLFALVTPSQAAVKKATLQSLLGKSGIAFKLVKLDRTDGFLFGLSFKGNKIPSITIAPGFGRMLLVQVNGSDMIFQGDGTGKMQVVQADGDIGTALCVLNTVVDFLTGLQTCQGDPACLFTQIVTLVTNITTCSAGATQPTL